VIAWIQGRSIRLQPINAGQEDQVDREAASSTLLAKERRHSPSGVHFVAEFAARSVPKYAAP